MFVIDTVCGFDDLDLTVLLVPLLLPSYIDDLVVAENVDSPFAGIESGARVGDVVLTFVVVSVWLFVVASEFQLSIDQRSLAAGFESYLAYYDPSETGLL